MASIKQRLGRGDIELGVEEVPKFGLGLSGGLGGVGGSASTSAEHEVVGAPGQGMDGGLYDGVDQGSAPARHGGGLALGVGASTDGDLNEEALYRLLKDGLTTFGQGTGAADSGVVVDGKVVVSLDPAAQAQFEELFKASGESLEPLARCL
jgi:hypothetical protein